MKIRKMTASFGKLKNSTMELSPGLNIINAPNEFGKSTWCGFINAMLYGIDTSERDRNGYLSAKTRYRPWDGGAMIGTMEIEHNGRSITIQRSSKGTVPMKNMIAVYTGTAEFIKDFDESTIGEELTGVSKQVFERTAFVRRPDMRIDQTAELEKRISSIVSSGEEGASYTETDKALRAWQRKLRYNNTGSLPQLEKSLKEAQHKMELIESSSDEISSLRGTMDRLNKQIELMKQDLIIHDKLDQRASARKLEEAHNNARRAKETVHDLTAAITKNGHKMTRADIASIRETAAAVVPLRNVAADSEKALRRAEKDLADTTAKVSSSPLNGRSETEIKDDISKAHVLEDKVKNYKEPKIPKCIPVSLIIVAVLGLLVCSGLLYPFTNWIPSVAPFVGRSYIGLAAFFVLLGCGAALFFIKPPARRSNPAAELSAILNKYSVASSDKLASLLTYFTALKAEEEKCRAARDAAKLSFESASSAAEDISEKAVTALAPFIPEVKSGEEVISKLEEMEQLIDKLTHAEFDAVSSQNVYETLLADYDDSIEVDDSYLPMPLRNREDTILAIERAKSQLNDATRAYDLATGAQRTLGDPAVIEGEIQSISEQIAEGTRSYNALALASETLSDVNAELQTRFSPIISKKAGEIMSELTGGKYEKLFFDKGFEAGAKESTSPESHSVITLSDGTADEIYLSLRLAMCDLILDGDDPSPIILDDALANFDDVRCTKALDFLADMAKKRQILLFSCHSRESRYLDGRDDVNIICF